MKKVLVMSLLALVVMTMSSCLRVKIDGKDWNFGGHTNDTPTQVHQVGEVTSMAAFDAVDVAGPFNVIFEQGESHSVRVEGTAEQLGKMTIYVKDSELVIDQRKNESGDVFKGLQVFVTSPMVDGLSIAGSGTITAPNALNVNDMRLEIAGSGEITLAQLTSKDLYMEIAGSGDITLGTVQANEARSEIAGSGNIEVASLTCKKANNEIAGSGDITLNNLNVDHVKSEIAGSGNVILRGKVGSHDEEIAGSGKVNVSGLKN
jgi:hypothetical protein